MTEYQEYFYNLLKSDISLCIRGDRIWTYSLLDFFRANNIICFINADHRVLGFEKIDIDPEDLFFFFNTNEHSVEYIYNSLANELQNKDKILKMKRNTRSFYKKYLMTDRLYRNAHNHQFVLPWLDFYAAKLLETKENDFYFKDFCLFSPQVHKVKNL